MLQLGLVMVTDTCFAGQVGIHQHAVECGYLICDRLQENVTSFASILS